MKCTVCKEHERVWIWQPMGPSEKENDTFMVPGFQYRGFPSIGICDNCKQKIEKGGETHYTYKGKEYVANEQPRPVYYPADVHAELWHGGTGSWSPDGSGNCTMICRDIEGKDEDHDIVALVVDPQLAELFLIAPQLLTCSEVLQSIVETHQEQLGEQYRKAVEALASLDFARLLVTK